MLAWWHARRHGACGGGGPYNARWHAHEHHEGDDLGGGSFGVRRPLRFLAFKLDLDEAQVSDLATILAELKTERAQAAVDHRRTTSAFADALAAETFDVTKVKETADDRVKSAQGLRDAVVTALGKIHALLRPDQRAKLAYLLRTGALSI
jgi:Spy/CpxP family protein refolding chaperone